MPCAKPDRCEAIRLLVSATPSEAPLLNELTCGGHNVVDAGHNGARGGHNSSHASHNCTHGGHNKLHAGHKV